MLKRLRNAFGLLCLFAAASVSARQADSDLDLRSIPIAEWLNNAETEEIPWSITVRPVSLGMDQRLEVLYTVMVGAKDLNRLGKDHELFLVSRISTPDSEWLNEASILRQDLDEELPNNVRVAFNMRVAVQPGDYVLWLVLYDRKTGKHNFAKRRIRIPEMRGDPFPDLYRRMPLVEFPVFTGSDGRELTYVNSELWLPVGNKRPIQLELITMFSPPEQWTGRSRAVRIHNDNTIGALAALTQMDLTDGTISITGLDLARREVSFEQRQFRHVEWGPLLEALKKAQSPGITAKALQGSKENGAFFRDFLDRRLSEDSTENEPLRVVIVVTSSWLFEKGADLKPIQIEGDCNCRIYHLRFRLNANDVFDQLERFMRPLRPKTFNLVTARDLRRAIAEIVAELRNL